jgi:hypothetical protein
LPSENGMLLILFDAARLCSGSVHQCKHGVRCARETPRTGCEQCLQVEQLSDCRRNLRDKISRNVSAPKTNEANHCSRKMLGQDKIKSRDPYSVRRFVQLPIEGDISEREFSFKELQHVRFAKSKR